VNFILNQVVQFEHGHDANRHWLIIELACSTIAHQLFADGRHGVARFKHKLLSLLFDRTTVELGGNWLSHLFAPEQKTRFYRVLILSSPFLHRDIILGEGGDAGRIESFELQPHIQSRPASQNLVLFQGKNVLTLIHQYLFKVEQTHFLIIQNHLGVMVDRA